METTRYHEFGPFRIDISRRRLLRHGERVTLTVKAFDTLLALVERHGQVVEKDALMNELWPDTVVQESNLSQQIFTLRRVLGESPDDPQFIATVPRRGYRFVAAVTSSGAGEDATGRALDAPSPARAGVEAERKQVTVLFCRFPNASAIAERLGHFAMHATLARVAQTVGEQVRRYGGVVTQNTTDGFGVIFGAPVVHEDDARRAVLAALAIRDGSLDQGCPDGIERDDLVAQIGLNTGPAIVSRTADARVEYTPVGDTTNLAAMLQHCAPPGAILVGGATRRLVEDDVRLDPVALSVPGRGGSIDAWSVVELRPERAQLDHRLRRTLAPFVGRLDELAVLEERLHRAAGREGQVVNVVGEPGIGKSRLLYELRHAGEAGVTFFEARCLSYASAIPYVPVLDVVRQACGIGERDDAETVRRKVGGVEGRPYLLHVLGAGDPGAPLPEVSPEALKARTFGALTDLVLGACRQGVLVLLLEDLHWIDRPSEEFFEALIDQLAGAPVLVVATSRPGYRAPWVDRSYTTQIGLRPLNSGDSLAVLGTAMGLDEVPASFSSAVLNRAEGNPFFLEELGRAVIDHEAVQRLIPDTIQGVIMARLDRLPETSKRLLQTASVAGREVPRRLLVRMWDGPERFEQDLLELRRLEFLYERPGHDEPTYVFKHALTQDVAYDSLLRARRRALHLRAGEALESLYADRLEEVEGALAYHYARTTMSDKAVTYLIRVADKAARVYANNEAVAHLEQALEHLQRCPDTLDRDRRILDVALRHAHSLYFLGRFRESANLLLSHESRLARIDDATIGGRYFSWLGHMFARLGDPNAAVHHAERAIAQALRAGDDVALGRAHGVLALDGFWSGCPVRGIAHGQQATALLEAAHDHWWAGMAHCYVAFSYLSTGQFDEALAATGRVRAAGVRIGDARLQTYADFTAGWAHANRGDGQLAVDVCRRGLELAPDQVSRAYATMFLGYAYLEQGEIAGALVELESATAELERFGIPYWHGWAVAMAAEAHRLAGDTARAEEYGARALEITTRVGYRLGMAVARRALGRAACGAGRPADAEGHLREALRVFGEIGADFEAARTRQELAAFA